jgi:two-component system, NarL family, response regulator LiaR
MHTMSEQPENSQIIQIIVADDHPVVRDGLVAMLNTQADFMVIGECENGHQLVQNAQVHDPDIILLDLEMPDMDGVEALERIKETKPDIKVLVFTAYATDERILGAVRAGAKGYLLKGSPREEIFKAIRIISQGGSTLEPVVASKLLQYVSADQPARPGHTQVSPLTVREMEVLNLLARGLTNKEIAAQLFVTERTVKFHVSSIFRKLGAGNRTEAVHLAVNSGLIET